MNAFGLKDDVTDFIVEKAKSFGMAKVVLFGSRAKGTFSAKSDIDLAVSGDSALAFKEVIEEECPTLLMFDIVDMSNDISTKLRNRIEEEGVVLYEICEL